MAKQKKQTRGKTKEKAPHFIDEPFFDVPIKELKRSPGFVPGRSLEEQLRFDRPRRRHQRGGVRRVKG